MQKDKPIKIDHIGGKKLCYRFLSPDADPWVPWPCGEYPCGLRKGLGQRS